MTNNIEQNLCKKILRHYYTREICCETVGRWKLFLSDKMKNIMPYYNQLYQSELLKIDPLVSVNRSVSHEGSGSETKTTNRNGTNSSNSRLTVPLRHGVITVIHHRVVLKDLKATTI